MTTPDSSSAESSMGDGLHERRTLTKPRNLNKDNRRSNEANGENGDANGEQEEEEECDVEVWETLSTSFRQVQSVLDQNRVLIQQVNENHQSKIPDNLAKNIALIREINGNISKVILLYSDLSANFSSIVQQRRAVMASKDSNNYSSSCNNRVGRTES